MAAAPVVIPNPTFSTNVGAGAKITSVNVPGGQNAPVGSTVPGSSPANPQYPTPTQTTPAGTQNPAPAPTNPPVPVASPTNPDSGYAQAEKNITPTDTPTEEDFFSRLYQEMSPVIDSINQTEAAAETAAYAAGSKEETDLNASLGDRGLGGSSTAAELQGRAGLDVASNIAQAKQAQSTALSNAYQYLTGQAHTDFNDALKQNTDLSQDYVTAMQSNALATVKGIAESGITSGTELQQKNPQAYAALLQYYNGDTNALNSALVMNQPNNKVVQSWTNGSTYYQLVTDPITGQPKVQQLDTGVSIPTSWTPNKVSTNTLMMQDPSNPANSIIYTTDPISGQVTVSGTGTGQSLAAQYNTQGGDSSGNTSGASAAAQNYVTTAISTAGVPDPTQPFVDAVSGQNGVGLGAMVAGIQKAEGGSPSGVVNNPGNVKYVAGMAGATDSGVKATDGGTFASFTTPEAGQQAIAGTLNSIAQGIGSNATVQDVLDKYANLGTTSSQGPVGTNGLPISQYGALANVQGFDPGTGSDAQITDSMAYNYLTEYLNGQTPSASSLGISTRTGSGAQFDKAAQRAKTLYNQATGQNLPNQTVLTNNLGLVSKNNALLNNLNVQTGVIQKNFGLSLDNQNASNVNELAPAINKVLNSLSDASGSTSVAQYLSQNETLQQELAALLSVKNASGVTVADKLSSQDLLKSGASVAQQKQILSTLMKEAGNQQQTIGEANAELYKQTDPLGLDPNNPVNAPGYQEMTQADATNNYDGTWTLNGQTVQVNLDGTVTPVS